MSLELLVLKKEWFTSAPSCDRFKYLAALLNKGYDKARIKFGIISSYRVKNTSSLIEDFSINKTEEFALILLLGAKDTFQSLREEEEDYHRDFLKISQDAQDMYNCDIPDKYLGHFDLDSKNVRVTIADPNFNVDESVIERVLSTVGLKKYPHSGKYVEKLELTAFTSFLRSSGPKVLDMVIETLIHSNKYLVFNNMPTEKAKIILLAEVITQHKLVEYYTQNCNFRISDKEQMLVEATNDGSINNSPFESDIFATMNFNIAYLHREILIQ